MLLGSNPTGDQVVPDSVSKGKVVVPGRRDISVLHQSVVDMTIERLLHFGNILYLDYPPHGDLLPFVWICLHTHVSATVQVRALQRMIPDWTHNRHNIIVACTR